MSTVILDSMAMITLLKKKLNLDHEHMGTDILGNFGVYIGKGSVCPFCHYKRFLQQKYKEENDRQLAEYDHG